MPKIEKVMPDEIEGTVTVSQDEFFEIMGGPWNVHPRIVSEWDDTFGYRSDWRLQSMGQRLIGVTIGGTHLSYTRYMVVRSVYEERKGHALSHPNEHGQRRV